MKVIGRLKSHDFDGIELLCSGTITKKKVVDIPGLTSNQDELWYFEPDKSAPHPKWSVCIWDEKNLNRFIKEVIEK